jgi:hypothetical protein
LGTVYQRKGKAMRERTIVTDKIAGMMIPADRKALGILTQSERQKKVDGTAEKEIQRLCEMELSRRGIVYLHLSPMAREKCGWPDLTFVVLGVPYAVELKTAAGKLSEDQIRVMREMERNGWRTHIVRSFEEFRELLK